MNEQIFRIYRIIKTLLSNFPENQNPIELRIGHLLKEIEWALEHIDGLMKKETINKDQLKYFLSIIYRDDDALEPLVLAWIRASTWMESGDPQELNRRKDLNETIKKELKGLVPYIEVLFGRDQMRYIVPPLYRSEKMKEV